MPIYEYRCTSCRRKYSKLWRTYSDAKPLNCPECQTPTLVRLISRVSVLRSEENVMDDLADPSNLDGVDENDPKSIARWMRKMGREVGEDLGPEFDEVVDRLEAGQSPEEIEQTIPDVAPEQNGLDSSLDF